MNNSSDEPADFKSDYKLLEIGDRADWKTARASYRRLVHLWHPDRYAQRPREREYAQRQFISLTKSYDNLRTFQRKNGYLPFEPGKPQEPSEQLGNKAKKNRKRNSNSNSNNSKVRSEFPDSVEKGILGSKSSTKSAHARSVTGKLIWVSCIASLLFLTIVVFYLLDRRSNQRIMDAGRETVRQAPDSEFMPSASEIRKSETRGAFVQPNR